jgi:hypothetical protein
MMAKPGEFPVTAETVAQAEENLHQCLRYQPTTDIARQVRVTNAAQLKDWIARAKELLRGK